MLPTNILGIIEKFIMPYNTSKAIVSPFIHHTCYDELTKVSICDKLFNNILFAKLNTNLKGKMVISGIADISMFS